MTDEFLDLLTCARENEDCRRYAHATREQSCVEGLDSTLLPEKLDGG